MSYSQAAPLTEARSHFATAVVDGRIYVFGGGGTNFESLASVEMYDPVTDHWHPRAPMPAPRSGIAAAARDGKVLVMGGGYRNDDGTFDFKSVVEIYDPVADTWENGPSLLQRHDAPAALEHDGHVYLFGGHHPEASGGPLIDPAFDFCELLDQDAKNWQEIAPMPTPRFSLVAVAMPDGIWCMGGGAFQNGDFNNLDVIEVYDPLGSVWGEAPTKLPWGSAGLYAAMHGNALYVAGGNDGTDITARAACYIPSANVWEDMPDLPEARVMGAMASVDGELFLMGGRGPDGKSVVDTCYRLDD